MKSRGRRRRKDELLYIRDAHGITSDSVTDLEYLDYTCGPAKEGVMGAPLKISKVLTLE